MEKAEEGRWNAPLGSPAQPLGAAAWDAGLYPSLFQPALTPSWANHFLTLCLIVTAWGPATQWSRHIAHPNQCRQRDLGADCSWVTIFSVNFNFCLHNANDSLWVGIGEVRLQTNVQSMLVWLFLSQGTLSQAVCSSHTTQTQPHTAGPVGKEKPLTIQTVPHAVRVQYSRRVVLHHNSLTHPLQIVLEYSQLCWSHCFPVRDHLGLSLLSLPAFHHDFWRGAFTICFPLTFVNMPLKIASH